MGDRIRRHIVFSVAVVLAGVFFVGDAFGAIEDYLGVELHPSVVLGITIAGVIIAALVEIWQLDSKLDELTESTRMTARVDSQSWERSQNVGGQCDLRATVLVNIWTDISLQTDRLALNVIGIGPRRAVRLWRRRREVLFGLPPVNPQSLLQEKSQVFRHRLDAKGPQPFEAAAMFEHSWETPEWVEDYAFELVLLTGAPYRRFSVGLDFDRGRERYRPL